MHIVLFLFCRIAMNGLSGYVKFIFGIILCRRQLKITPLGIEWLTRQFLVVDNVRKTKEKQESPFY